MQVTASSEIVILLAFEVNSTNASGLVRLCYPFFTLESILPRLGQQTYVRQSRMNKDELVRQNRRRLGAMEVPVVAELGRTSISLGEAESLGEGDIIRLATRTGDPAIVYLGGQPKFTAQPFAEGNGELKLQVVDRLPVKFQGKYGTVHTDSAPTPVAALLAEEVGPVPEGEKQEEVEPEEVDPEEGLDPAR